MWKKRKKEKKKIHKTPDTFRQFERQNSSLQLMKIKREKQPRREKPQPELASPSSVNRGRKERTAREEFPLSPRKESNGLGFLSGFSPKWLPVLSWGAGRGGFSLCLSCLGVGQGWRDPRAQTFPDRPKGQWWVWKPQGLACNPCSKHLFIACASWQVLSLEKRCLPCWRSFRGSGSAWNLNDSWRSQGQSPEWRNSWTHTHRNERRTWESK